MRGVLRALAGSGFPRRFVAMARVLRSGPPSWCAPPRACGAPVRARRANGCFVSDAGGLHSLFLTMLIAAAVPLIVRHAPGPKVPEVVLLLI